MSNQELTCAAVIAKLTEYLEQAAPPRQMVRITTHLQACSDCRALYDELKRNTRILSHMPNEPAPETLKTSLLTTLRSQASRNTPESTTPKGTQPSDMFRTKE